MHSRSMRNVLILASLLALILPAAVAAQTSQTISIDGVNDFDPSNLIDADGGDTEHTTIDLGEIYVTNDAVNLYVGMEHDQGGWSTVQLGMAIDVGTPDGGIADPWGRQLEWSLAANKPDFMFYVNLDNDWQAGYYWDGAAWVDLGSGTGALGWHHDTGFDELSVLLSTLGVAAGDPLNVEMWVTQDGGTKGPLDAAANDASQLSTPTSTLFDTPSPIPMFDYHGFTVLAASDPTPPTVTGASHTVASVIDVSFNEPVDATTAEVAGNYSVSGATVVSATRVGSGNVVELGLAADIGASASLYTVTVTNVQDLAGNPIVADGTGNVACFMVKSVLFRGRMSHFLSSQTEPYGGFTVEGSPSPLSWALCDGMDGVDVGGDVYEVTAEFSVTGDCAGGTAEAGIEWKWVYDCDTYEPLAGNRTHTVTLADGAADTLDVWWNDQDPSQFTLHDIDVEFFVDLNAYGYTTLDTVSINGSVLPLNWNVPSEYEMVDDGTGNDAVADDGVFSALVTFPAGTEKNFTYKYLLNHEYECSTQGDRTVYLNDELFDTVGGALGPLTLPVVHYDRCTATWRGVEVVFSVDAGSLGALDVVSVNGTPSNLETPVFDWSVPSLNPLADDGVAPDATAGDGIYTVSVVFADSSEIWTEYKYLLNDVYECADQGNRNFTLDADNYDDAGNPQVLPTDVLHQCHTTDAPVPAAGRFVLEANQPNPFNPTTEIRFTVNRAGRGSLRIYNLKGELTRTLVEGHLDVGLHAFSWDGRDSDGGRTASGVYFYQLVLDTQKETRKMVMLK